ncbi:MAG: hypothetical protein HRT69_12790 [Flavobacteriaceae bacterium]|nr:hypothetical protein [Flavobacteriaceae bacterium]
MKYKKWTIEELEYLKKYYPNTGNEILANHFGISKEKVQSKSNVIGIRKSEEFISELRSKILESKGKNTHTNMLSFGKSLYPNEHHFSLVTIYNKIGIKKFKEMYKLHSA